MNDDTANVARHQDHSANDIACHIAIDWLEGNSDSVRAEYVRVRFAQARLRMQWFRSTDQIG